MTNSPKPKSWRDVLPIHPAAELFPTMSEFELRELGENIKALGGRLIQAVHLYKGKLLDGRNRLDAMELVGFTFDDAGLNGYAHHLNDSVDPYDYVLAANLHRRHLTGEQKRELIAKILKAKPAASNVTIAKQAKANDKTVAKVRAGLERRSEIPNVKARTDTKGRKQPASKPKRPPHKDVGTALPPDDASKSRPAVSAEVSTEQRKVEMAALAVVTVEDDLEADEYREAFLLRAADAMAFAVYPGKIDKEVVDAAKRVAAKWENFTRELEARYSDSLSIPEFLRAQP